MNKWVYKTTDRWQISFHKTDDGEFMFHIDVYIWNKSVYKEMLEEWADIEDMLEFFDVEIVYGLLPIENEQFAAMFGWTLTSVVWHKTHRLVFKLIGE